MTAADPLVVYTDGACSGNPGPGGWAWAVPDGPYASGPAANTTNQRMEIEAALDAVRVLGDPARPLEVVSDSTYVVNCFRDRWYDGWHRRGWVNSQRKPVANRDLWEPLIDRVLELGNVTFRWVKGHSGDPMNDRVDALAVEAAKTQAGRSGSGDPAAATTAAAAGSGTDEPTPDGAGLDALEGFVVVVTGLRPDALGLDEHAALADAVRTAIAGALAATAAGRDDVVVASGLRLGSELSGAEAALELGLPLAAVLPFPEPHAEWAAHEQVRFDAALARADAVITLEPAAPATRAQVTALLARRDAAFVRRADAAVVVHDGRDARTARVLDDLRDRLGSDAVVVIDPARLARPSAT
ncbi:MAG: RNase H family protein [Acidimicrobiales bacterium]